MSSLVGPLLAVAGVASLVSAAASGRSPRTWMAMILAASLGGLGAGLGVLGSGAAWVWNGGLRIGGEPVQLVLDGVSAWFLVLVTAVGAAGALYSREYWPDGQHPKSAPRGRAWWSGLLLSLGMVLLARNGLHFLLAWEAFTVCAYFLITLESRHRAVREAGWLYLAASHAGTLALFAMFSWLAAATGSWELGPMRDRSELAPLYWLALLGFGVKAGVFPLHIWLPSAHARAPSHVSAILSGVAIKMGIFGIVRFGGWLPVPEPAAWLVAMGGVVSAVLGVAFALGQHDLKRLLAYHSVENIGIILIGVGFALVAAGAGHPRWGAIALAGGLLHVWNHGLFKALLFLGAGSVLHATGTREMSALGGLWRAMPWTTSLFAVGSIAIAGLPPLNGFVSEWLVFLGLFEALQGGGVAAGAALPAVILLAATGALALACFVKVCGVVFLGAPRSAAAAGARESGRWMRIPMLGLAGACLAVGLVPIAFWPLLHAAVATWEPGWREVAAPNALARLGGIHLGLIGLAVAASFGLWRRVRRGSPARAVTWDCGYARPSARMQYTAGSFAGIIIDWFAWILRPERRGEVPDQLFPGTVAFEVRTPETVLEAIVEPAARRVSRLSGWIREWQHGRVQAYLFYLVLGMGGLAILVTCWSQ